MSAMARRTANFSHDRRGCVKLLAHVTGLLESGALDKDIIELNLSGTRASSGEDRRHIQKIVGTFAQVRAINLNGCCLQEVGFLAQLLCSKYFSCKRVDLTGNYLTKCQLARAPASRRSTALPRTASFQPGLPRYRAFALGLPRYRVFLPRYRAPFAVALPRYRVPAVVIPRAP